jgi:hypothetical protein
MGRQAAQVDCMDGLGNPQSDTKYNQKEHTKAARDYCDATGVYYDPAASVRAMERRAHL